MELRRLQPFAHPYPTNIPPPSDSPFNYNITLLYVLVSQLLPAPNVALSEWNKLGVKQIQMDSLSYRLVGGLVRTGLYVEAVSMCGDVIGVVRNSGASVAENAGVAFERGNYMQVMEMVAFQSERMDKSLQLLEAKAIMLACAAVSTDGLGEIDGVCASLEDVERAKAMSDDRLSTYGMLECMEYEFGRSDVESTCGLYSDNRDLQVLGSIDFETQGVVDKRSVVVGAGAKFSTQKVVFAAVNCSGGYKPPKKGKMNAAVVKSGVDLAAILEEAGTAVAKQDAIGGGWPVLAGAVRGVAGICVGKDEEAAAGIEAALEALEAFKSELVEGEYLVGGKMFEVDWLSKVCAGVVEALIPICAVVNALCGISKKKKAVRANELRELLVILLKELKERMEAGAGGEEGAKECVEAMGGDASLVAVCGDVLEGCKLSAERVGRILGELVGNLTPLSDDF